MQKLPLLLALVPALLPAAGCVAAAAGAAAGYLVSQEVLPDDVQQATVTIDVDRVWRVSQSTLGALSTTSLDRQDFPRSVKGEVDGAAVTVEVFAYDLDRTIINVEARKYGMARGDIAERVMNEIIADLGR